MRKIIKNSNKLDSFTAHLPKDFNFPADAVGRKLLAEYGAVFVADGGSVPPKSVIFKNEQEVFAFQQSLSKSTQRISGFEIELQTAAMNALKKAIVGTAGNDLTITPRGADSAKRNYAETVELWASRVNPALSHWVEAGKLTETKASEIFSLSPFEQVPEIFKLESQGIFFSKDLSKTIIYSVAPPGTSQHLSMLALDVREHADEKVRAILAVHGWFQTVVSDLPHFTFLGVPESQIASLGLKQVFDGGRSFWLPDI